MPKQINSFILLDDLIKEMKDKIKETRKIKIEVGFALCKNPTKNIITRGTECVGTKCSIKTGMCLTNQKYIGNYHTHPVGAPTMSITDMITGCEEDIECIGSVPFNKIRCFTRKTDSSECINEITPFEDEEHKIIATHEEIRKELRDPVHVFKTGAPQFIKKITQYYEKDVVKYHTNRLRLLNKNFNRIDIS